jgi:toxin-antitoxin system PIN domain toxin
VIAVDTNILVYAFRKDSPFHTPARACLEALAEGRGTWAIPWPCVHEFLSITTNPKIYRTGAPEASALAAVDAWRKSPSLVFLCEVESHWRTLRQLLEQGRVRGGMVHDARVAALCLQHGVREFWTADRDFSRFPALKVVNPLVLT